MKKLLLSGILFSATLLSSPAFTSAANCTTDLVSGIKFSADWNQQYIIYAKDGTAWQRAIISYPNADLLLKEGDNVVVQGTADPNSEVQIFMFSPEDNGNGGVKRPGMSSCFSGGKANNETRFTFSIPTRAIWDSVGTEMYIDAFFKMDQLWSQQTKQNTNHNYFIGTHSEPTKVNVVAHNVIPEGCEALCKGVQGSKGLQRAVIIDPSKWPAVVNENFKEVQPGEVVLGNFGHTFYAGTKKESKKEALANLSLKVLTVELLKRFLNGSISSSLPAMEEISSFSMVEASSGLNYALDIQAVAKNIKTAMTAEMLSPERDAALTALVTAFQKNIECAAPECAMPSKQTFSEIFPPQQAETEWDDLFMEILMMWTERPDNNKCIVEDEKVKELKKTLQFEGHHHRLFVECDWLMTYTHGYSSPAIIINTNEKAELKPKFKAIRITKSDTPFDTANSWQLAAGEKDPIYYRYESTLPLKPKTGSSSCLKEEDLADFAEYIGEKVSLSNAEKKMFVTELAAQIPEENDSYLRFSLADQVEIANRFGWELNGEPADILQLFFKIESNTCSEKRFDLSTAELLADGIDERDGLEVGVVRE